MWVNQISKIMVLGQALPGGVATHPLQPQELPLSSSDQFHIYTIQFFTAVSCNWQYSAGTVN